MTTTERRAYDDAHSTDTTLDETCEVNLCPVSECPVGCTHCLADYEDSFANDGEDDGHARSVEEAMGLR